jgi:putative transposase
MSELCKAVKMSRQNYYKARSQRQGEDCSQIMEAVQNHRERHPMAGARKLQYMLRADGVNVGRDRLLRLLRDANLLVSPPPRKARTTDSRHNLPIFTNLIKDVQVTGPDQVWVSDLTYIRIDGGFVYLSLIMDLYSRMIIGWHCGDTLEAIGCMEALRDAYRLLPSGRRPIHHSDRGCQYCCHAYVDLLKSRNLRISMTEQNHCYENAHAERLNGILKQEYGLGSRFPSKKLASEAAAQAVYLYNNERLHEALGYKTPVEVHHAA